MSDPFINTAASLAGPAGSAFAIIPSDGADLQTVTRGLYVGTAGNIAVVMLSGETVTFASVPGGSLLPIRVRGVRSTGTSASAILGLC